MGLVINKKSPKRIQFLSFSSSVLRYHPPPAIFFETAGGKRILPFFIGMEDGDKQTVFLNRTDWFQRTGWFFWNRIINGLSLGF
jgi:hypothetical protein